MRYLALLFLVSCTAVDYMPAAPHPDTQEAIAVFNEYFGSDVDPDVTWVYGLEEEGQHLNGHSFFTPWGCDVWVERDGHVADTALAHELMHCLLKGDSSHDAHEWKLVDLVNQRLRQEIP